MLYLSSDTADNMTFSNSTDMTDDISLTDVPLTLLEETLNFTAANSSGGNGTRMNDCDTKNPVLIIITQVTNVSSPTNIVI